MDNLTLGWGTILTAVLIALIPVLSFGTGWMYVRLREEWETFKATRPDMGSFLEQAGKYAVEAAEQAGIGKVIKDKKQYALDVATAWLKAHNFPDVDLFLLEAEIERQVWLQLNKWDRILDDGRGEM